jgi:hypothetical protein
MNGRKRFREREENEKKKEGEKAEDNEDFKN